MVRAARRKTERTTEPEPFAQTTGKARVPPPVEGTGVDPRDVEPGQKLELYVKHDCPYCREARAYYDGRGLAYTLYDAQNDAAARRRMFALANDDPTVPAIVVDGAYVQSGWGTPPRG